MNLLKIRYQANNIKKDNKILSVLVIEVRRIKVTRLSNGNAVILAWDWIVMGSNPNTSSQSLAA